MEIRTDFTALVLPSAAELELAAERARRVTEASGDLPRRSFRLTFGIHRRVDGAATRHAVAR